VIEFIFAGGVIITPLIIIKEVIIQTRWFLDIRDNDIAVDVFNSDYFNDFFSFQWLQHWNRLNKRTQQSVYRLLIINEYEFHLSFQFVRYCEMEKIIFLRFQFHSTHFLQPLNIVIFQQWKLLTPVPLPHSIRSIYLGNRARLTFHHRPLLSSDKRLFCFKYETITAADMRQLTAVKQILQQPAIAAAINVIAGRQISVCRKCI
jgi:hypothetical protein